eukprot:Selendium_serpulae@DN3838_c0_g1_i4.p1
MAPSSTSSSSGAAAGATAGVKSMQMFDVLAEYLRHVTDKVGGLKVLLLDSETQGIISLVLSQSEVLAKEVFLVQRLDSSEEREQMLHLNAICFLRPTPDNFIRLVAEFKAPKYSEYHLFFSNSVEKAQLERLARCDELEVVQQVHEYFADVYCINKDLFTLNLASTVGLLTQDPGCWSPYEEATLLRIVDGLFSVLVATQNVGPIIRYQSGSDICWRLSKLVAERLRNNPEIVASANLKGSRGPTLLILDRREDPITPLLNQWTYQAMVHELIGTDLNRVELKRTGTAPAASDLPDGQIVLSSSQDAFFEQNLLANFGDLGVAIKKYVEAYQTKTKGTAQVETIEDMQRFMSEYPEFKRLSGNVSLHVAVVHELSRIVRQNGLFEASSLEQELACAAAAIGGAQKQEHLRLVFERLRSSNCANMERLRLVLLFALRYENDPALRQLKDELTRTGIDSEQLLLVDAVMRFAGVHQRSGDLFQNKTLFDRAKVHIQRGFKGVDNVYTQHQSLLGQHLTSLLKGKLKDAQFPGIDCRHGDAAADNGVPNDIIVFVMGGVTLEEARDASVIAQREAAAANAPIRVVLGGTTLLNTKAFLADISQLIRTRNQRY